jgi:hypothetical protein
MAKKHLFLVASSAVEGVGDGLAGVGETLLSGAEDGATLLLGGVTA